MASQSAFGLFQYVPSISQGDPYEKADKAKANTKTKGKQFSIRSPKSGKTNDAFFDKTYSSVYVGSKYTTFYDLDSEYQKTKKQKQIVPTPFKPSTPSKTMEGLGSYYGAFGKWPHMKSSDEFDKREKGAPMKTPSPKNFLTSPSKSGHVGLLGCIAGSKGVVNEYKYESEPPLPRPKKEQLAPFKPSSPAKRGLFSQDCHVTFTPISYATEGPRPRQTRSSDGVKPFRPANVILNKGPVGRIYGTVNPFPEYKEQGPPLKAKAAASDVSPSKASASAAV